MLVNLSDDEPEPGAMDMQYKCMAPSRVNSLNANEFRRPAVA
jgi:hypothetical protein